jgi:hypothetical protein
MKVRIVTMTIILLVAASYLGAEARTVLPDLLNPKTITVEGKQMYITDLESIYLYSLTDFKLQEKFGKRGEGPGEFKVNPIRFITISLLPDSVLVDSIGKITYFSREGKYLKEMKAPIFGGVIPLGEKFVAYAPGQEQGVDYGVVSIYKAGANNSLEKEQEVYKFKFPFQRANVKIDPVNLIRFPMAYTHQNKIFIDDGLNGKISVFDADGKPLNTIQLAGDKIPLEGKLKDEYVESFKTSPQYKPMYEMFKQRMEFSGYLPRIRDYRVIDNKIYILTYKREPGKGEFYIYESGGNFLKRVMVPFKEVSIIEFFPYTVKDNKIYQLVEDPDNEQWYLQVSGLN